MRQPQSPKAGPVATGDDVEDADAQDAADGRAGGDEGAEEGLATARCVLGDHEEGAGLLTAHEEALQHAEPHQQDRREDADRGVGGEQTIATVQAPVATSEMTSIVLRENRSPKWPNTMPPSGRDRKARAERHERQERADQGVGLREEQLREDETRGEAEDQEVVELDAGADGARSGDAAHLLRGGGRARAERVREWMRVRGNLQSSQSWSLLW